MFWYLEGSNGRNVIVDAGFIDTTGTGDSKYEQPDIVLKRLNVSPSAITDVIITHPHPDHIRQFNTIGWSRMVRSKQCQNL